MSVISLPVKCFVDMGTPYPDGDSPGKCRFFCRTKDVPQQLLDWMKTNPREQNLKSDVARTIAASVRTDHREFHLRNRGILLSVETVKFSPLEDDPRSGWVALGLTDPAIHGDIDGGHTLRIILAAQDALEGLMPEQYVEFEVISGLKSAVDVAEARNTSVALDVKTLEEMKGSYAVLKEVFEGFVVDGSLGDGSPFFDRVELRMNQQNDTDNAIDIRMLISILLMFNQDLFPVKDDDGTPVALSASRLVPIQMYGGKETALKKYLSLGGGTSEGRDAVLRQMAPIMRDIVVLWDCIERELMETKTKDFTRHAFTSKKKAPKAVFSGSPLPYTVPAALVYPCLSAFRVLVEVAPDGTYGWSSDPLAIWQQTKKELANYALNDLKSAKGNVNTLVKSNAFWYGLQLIVSLASAKDILKRTSEER